MATKPIEDNPLEEMEEAEGGEEGENLEELNRVHIRPKFVYGMRDDVLNSIHFNKEEEVIYPCEGVLVFQDYVANTQRYLRLSEEALPLILAVSDNRKLLAVVESHGRSLMYLCIYDTATLRRKRMQDLPQTAMNLGVSQMFFDPENRCITLLTFGPDEYLIFMMLDKVNTVLEIRPGMWVKGAVTSLCYYPDEHQKFLIAGEKLLLFMTRLDKGVNLISNIKSNYNCTSLSFIDGQKFLMGTDDNQIILFEKWEVKLVQHASKATVLDLNWHQEDLNKFLEDEPDEPEVGDMRDTNVLLMKVFPKGFAFVMFNRIYVFELVSKTKYERKTVLTLPIGIYDIEQYQITNMAINLRADTVIVVAKHPQIYVGILIVPETLKTRQLALEPLGCMLHISGIIACACCPWKKIVVTAGVDKTVRIWNYENGKIELIRKFQYDLLGVGIDPTGLILAIAFPERIRMAAVLLDDIKIIKHFNYPNTSCLRFSNGGHFLGVAFDRNVGVASLLSLETLEVFKSEEVFTAICWNEDDTFIYGCTENGTIMQWEIKSMTLTRTLELKNLSAVSLAVTSKKSDLIYAACTNGTIQEYNLGNNDVRELVFPSRNKCVLTNICVSRSDVVMFVSSSHGDLIHCELPLRGNDVDFIETHFFSSQINQIIFSPDSTLLFTVSSLGTFLIWALENANMRIKPIDMDLLKSHEILIQRSHLAQKNKQIVDLEFKLKSQQAEFEFTINQSEINESQQLETVHRTYCQALAELSAKNNEIEANHKAELLDINRRVNELKEENRRQLETLSNQYSERMLNEQQKFSRLRDSMLEMRENYEMKLKKSSGTLSDTIEGLEEDFKKQMNERRGLIRELMKEMQDKKVEFSEYCREVEVVNDRNKVALQVDFETKLTLEKNSSQYWMDKCSLIEGRYDEMSYNLRTLNFDVDSIKRDYTDAKTNLKEVSVQLADVKKELADRDDAIAEKEQRILDLAHRKTELEKYKLVLEEKITELKNYIGPKEASLEDKRKHISELEHELAGLKQSNTQLELQVNELRDKYISNLTELKMERQHARAARECIQNICMDMFYVYAKVKNIAELKEAVRNLFYRHATDDELKKYISDDPLVRDTFMKQRFQIESVLALYNSQRKVSSKAKLTKLKREHEILEQALKAAQETNEKLKAFRKIE